MGLQLKGKLWNRNNDQIGIALVMNGISKDHRDYLKKGGYGFIIGDGNLSYASELIGEVYYSFKLGKYPLWISPDYQFILNPAYNKDRGPVNAFGIRVLTAL
jgi:high affinity Mn2+ porin